MRQASCKRKPASPPRRSSTEWALPRTSRAPRSPRERMQIREARAHGGGHLRRRSNRGDASVTHPTAATGQRSRVATDWRARLVRSSGCRSPSAFRPPRPVAPATPPVGVAVTVGADEESGGLDGEAAGDSDPDAVGSRRGRARPGGSRRARATVQRAPGRRHSHGLAVGTARARDHASVVWADGRPRARSPEQLVTWNVRLRRSWSPAAMLLGHRGRRRRSSRYPALARRSGLR